MVYQCVVFGCRTNYPKLVDGKPEYPVAASVFSFPTEEAVKHEWVRFCKRDNFSPSKHSRICAHHFRDADILREHTFIVSGKCHSVPLKTPKLKKDAVPCLYTGEHASVLQRKLAKRRTDPEERRVKKPCLEASESATQDEDDDAIGEDSIAKFVCNWAASQEHIVVRKEVDWVLITAISVHENTHTPSARHVLVGEDLEATFFQDGVGLLQKRKISTWTALKTTLEEFLCNTNTTHAYASTVTAINALEKKETQTELDIFVLQQFRLVLWPSEATKSFLLSAVSFCVPI
jgi:hypothetical protein